MIRWTNSPLDPSITRHAPHVRGLRSVRGMMTAYLVALLPCALSAVYDTGVHARAAGGWRATVVSALGGDPESSAAWSTIAHGALYVGPILAVCLATAGGWAWIFGRFRGRRLGDDVAVTAVIFALILPPGAPLWQVALGMSFGAVLAKEVFGGTGRNFVHPALAGLAFLHLAYPEPPNGPIWTGVAGYGGTSIFATIAAGQETGTTWWRSLAGLHHGAMGVSSTAACGVGAVVLLATRTVSWRVMAAMVLGLIVAVHACRLVDEGPVAQLAWPWHARLGGFAFATVFLATDPVTACATNAGRWICGLLIGAMIVVVRVFNPVHPEGVMMAVLLGNVFAPMLDSGVTWWSVWRRARRAGREPPGRRA